MKKLTLIIILTTIGSFDSFGQNLISNWSFENFMQINCQSWYDGCGNELTISCDTLYSCQVRFYQDSPSDIPEELWCLKLNAEMLNEGLAETYITGQSGTNIYKLTYWMKSPGWTGSASIGTISQNQFTVSKTMADTTSTWKQYTFIDTLTTQASDTIAVRLSAGTGDFCICTTYFDLIELTILDTSTSIENINRFENDDIKVYPNPSRESITIEIKDNKNENYRLTVYSSTGQLIKTIETIKNILTFDNRDIASGLYFYQIISNTDKTLIGQGKFIIE